MENSSFKFSNPKLVQLNFEIYKNNEFDSSKDYLDVLINNNVDKKNENQALVELEISIGQNTDNPPFVISLIISAYFKLEKEIEGTDFDNLLQINAPTFLLSYARPIVSFITAQAGMKPLNLPFLNFTKQEQIN